ncbi:MAG: hypothetical protein HUJ99_08785, partial [Bacteroidaceae bacterium]|nr:hypothetical protein [Bacteroidaceae bacterium]
MDFPFILYSATLAYMVSGVICGFIRWFHMCKPFDQQPQFAYPARRALSIFYGLTLMLAPCLFDLNGTDCHVFLHSFFAIIYPCCFSWLFRRYFDFLGMFNWSYYLVPGLNFI